MTRQYVYWISTALLCSLYLASAAWYATQGDQVRQAFGALGYPAYLVPLLLAVKVLGIAAILARVSVVLSDLAYAGMFYHLLLSFSAHINVGDGVGFLPALIGLGLMLASFLTQNAARAKASPHAPSAAS
ncbi:DoxX family protein [Dickeya dianthicola]|uniref:DoxX family protein n=1 Tax=Dickeya dianthicola TaxID=204039 RepID=UPI00186641E6|nr:DoxX family protein [Dickeya dianthicola]QOL13687.1 DoxX family protein [Dickeya dianthicola]